MNYVEYNPANPAPFENYVPEVESKENKVLLIIIETGLLVCIGYLLYKHFQNINRFDGEHLQSA